MDETTEQAATRDETSAKKAEGGRNLQALAEHWTRELTAARKDKKKFETTARSLVKRYLDEREAAADGDARMNLFWSNTEVLKSALYAKPPNVDVSPAHKDNDDDIARVAGTILQRMLNHDVADDEDDAAYPDVTQQSVGDYLIVGLGEVWYRYEVETAKAKTEPVIDPATGVVLAEGVEYEVITHEDAVADYVHWEDFYWRPSRVWQEVTWVARGVHMTKEELEERFGKKIAANVPMSTGAKRTAVDSLAPERSTEPTAYVYEIWDRKKREVVWFVMGMAVPLDVKPDPLELRQFFPCPPPLLANATTSKVMPRADYLLAQDQYRQIDELTTRIKWLTKALKVVGAYDKAATPLSRIFGEGYENQMIPVDNWAAFAEKGGIKGTMDFVPIEVVAKVVETLTMQRDVLKAGLYEVLGIGDIMRGVTDPDETLGAQQLKAQFGGNRLQSKQQAIGRWIAAGQRIRAQIICRKFQPKTIMERSGIQYSNDAPLAEQAIAFLKSDDASKAYRIAIEPESMAMVDWAQERDSRSQFMEAVGAFVQSVTPLLQAQPQAAPVVLQMMKWGLGGFRVGKEIETVLDQAIAQASQPQAPAQPDPQAAADVAKTESETAKNKTQAIKNLTEAKATNMEAEMVGSMPMEPAPMEQTPVPQPGAM